MSGKVTLFFKIALLVAYSLSEIKAQLEEWKIPCGAVYLPKYCENASVETLKTVEDYERCAPARLDPLSRDYVWGAAGRQSTMYQNKDAYNRIWIKKTVLRGNSNYSLGTTVFGRRIGIPLGISPTVGQSIYHVDGERGMARAAASAGAVMILNGYSTTPPEVVAASVPPGTELWMQTYIFPKRQLTVQLVQRAERAGYKAIVVSIDEPFKTDIRCSSRVGFQSKYIFGNAPNAPSYLRQATSNETDIDRTLTFKDITWLANITKLPIVTKGILSAEDALQAIKAGASGIFVSNQGGRELDGCIPTIEALPSIVRAIKPLYPWVEIFVDGGIRSGYDMYKALARGAKMAFVGRPPIWGLAMGGEKGVNAVLNIFKEEFTEAMLHAGVPNPSLITPSSIISQRIYSDFY